MAGVMVRYIVEDGEEEGSATEKRAEKLQSRQLNSFAASNAFTTFSLPRTTVYDAI